MAMQYPRLAAGPPRVQIQTQSGCNGRCVFCPNYEALTSGLPQGRMAPELFRKIIDDLAPLHPRRVSLYLMNEPMLDNRLPEFVAYVTEEIPRASTLITSNGSYVTESFAEALLAAGLKRFKVSLQALDPALNRELMGRWIDSAKVIENVLTFQRVARAKGIRDFDLRVSTVVTNRNEHELPRMRRFWKQRGIRFVTSALENRGGNIQAVAGLDSGGMQARSGYCIRPFREMCVLFNGDVVLCCVDWFRTTVVGNLAEQSVAEVWRGPRLEEIRRTLLDHAIAGQPDICANCTESACPGRHRRGLGSVFRKVIGRR